MCIRVMCHKFCIIQPQIWHHPVLLQMMLVHVYHSIICIMRPVLSTNVEFIYKYVRKMLHKILMSCVIVVSSYQCWALLSLHIPQWNRLWTFSHPNTLFTIVLKKNDVTECSRCTKQSERQNHCAMAMRGSNNVKYGYSKSCFYSSLI